MNTPSISHESTLDTSLSDSRILDALSKEVVNQIEAKNSHEVKFYLAEYRELRKEVAASTETEAFQSADSPCDQLEPDSKTLIAPTSPRERLVEEWEGDPRLKPLILKCDWVVDDWLEFYNFKSRSAAQVAKFAGLGISAIYKWCETKQVHRWKGTDGEWKICPISTMLKTNGVQDPRI